MILAEIADKMLPASLYIGIAVFTGLWAAIVVTFLRGTPRVVTLGVVACLIVYFAWLLQVGSDLVEATRTELGQSYLVLSRYWFLGSIIVGIIFALIFRGVSRSIKPPQKKRGRS